MINITDGFTRISAGSDGVEDPEMACSQALAGACFPRRPTGARVTVEFQRTHSISPTQVVKVRYDFADNGDVRELVGIPIPTHTVVRQGRAVVYHYRMSH